MSIRIVIGDTVRVKVLGTYSDETGPKDFDFALLAKRLPADQLRERLVDGGDESVVDFLLSVVQGWEHVKDDAGVVPYSAAALQQLLQIHGLAALCLQAYVAGCGAQAKN